MPNTTADELNAGTACSLREAVQAANTDAAFGGCPAGSGTDVIRLASGATYPLGNPGVDANNMFGDLDIVTPLSLIAGPGGAVIDGTGAADRVLQVADPVTAVRIEVRDGSTTLRGGGILVSGTGALTLTDSTVADNFSVTDGGGIANTGSGTTQLLNVTIARNRAGDHGGGFYDDGAVTTTISSTTIALNQADTAADGDGDGGGISAEGPPLNIRNSVVAGNSDQSGGAGAIAPDCTGGPNSLGYNLVGNSALCGFNDATGDRLDLSARLGQLAFNGGPGRTVSLLTGSPAIDRARPGQVGTGGNACPARDERGISRRVGGRCDIGAYELTRCGGVAVTRIGTGGADTLRGGPGRDGILGFGGNDRLFGGGGNDSLCGAKGRDRLLGEAGRDLLLGQGGPDRLFGGQGIDRLVGGSQGDRLFGGARRDTLFGGPGPDLLAGGLGPDRMFGGAGRDRFIGGRAFDRCRGGPGRDRAASCDSTRAIP